MTSSLDILASDYALGVLSQHDRLQVEERVASDAALAERIAWWTECYAPLSTSGDEIAAPHGLLNRIEAQIDREIDAGGGGSVTIRDHEGDWIEFAPGARRKHLYYDEASQSEAFLIDLDAGAELPAHGHDMTEDCLVIKGDFRIGQLCLREGDFHAAFRSSRHEVCRSESGCRLFLKAAA